MAMPAIGQPLLGIRVGGDVPGPVSLRPATVVSQGVVDDAALLAELIRRISQLEKAVELKVDGDRVPSLLRLTKESAFLSADQVTVLGQTTLIDYIRDLNGNPTGQIDPRFTQITGNKIRTGIVTNFAGDAWMNLDAGRAGYDNTFMRVRNSVRLDADGYLQLGATTGKQFLYDPYTGVASIGDQVMVAGQSLGAVAGNANYGATRQVGDMTAQVLANSGTTIQSYSSTLFQFINGAFSLSVGAGGLSASYNGVPKLALSSYGSASFSGDLITSGQVKATGSTTDTISGNSASIVGVGYGSAAGVLGVVGSASSLAGVVGMGNGGRPGGSFFNFSDGPALIAGRSQISSLAVTGDSGYFTTFSVSGNSSVSSNSYVGGNATVAGNAILYSGLSVVGAASMGAVSVSSLNGYNSPNNITAFVGPAYPINTTTPGGFAQVRTLSGNVLNVPFYL